MIAIRDVKNSDIDWIANLLIEGGKQKHFIGTERREHAYTILEEAIFKNYVSYWSIKDLKKIKTFKRAETYIAEIDGSVAGFLLCSFDSNGMELHLAATKKEFRRKGCFIHLIDYAINNFEGTKKIYARCYEKSSWAINGLKKYGFVKTNEGKAIEFTLPT